MPTTKKRTSEQRRRYYLNERERVLAALKERRIQDPDAVKAYERQQYEKHREKRLARDKARYANRRSVLAANDAVGRAIKQGLILSAENYPCALCGAQAQDHHHQSYLPEDRLNVIPLCRSCHVKVHHRPELANSLGVVATKVGMVRIGIAETQ